MTSTGPEDDWRTVSADLPARLQHHAVIVHNGAMYVLGGDNGFWEGSTVSDRIFRAIPTANGDITEWVEVGQLPVPLTVHAVTILNDQIYVMGGSQTFRPGLTFEDTVFTAPFTEDGTVGDFDALATFPTPIGWLTAVALDQRIVALSGKTQFRPRQLSETVWIADVQTDGKLASFSSVSAMIPRQRHATVLVDRTVVVIAGGGEQQVMASVQAADVDEQGNMAAWQDLPPLPSPRYAHAAFTYNGDIYVSGGFVRYGSNETSADIFRLSLAD
ncbi:MAG: 4-oxalocrotonate tautomerase [Cyanobacteria bacterium J06632_22]